MSFWSKLGKAAIGGVTGFVKGGPWGAAVGAGTALLADKAAKAASGGGGKNPYQSQIDAQLKTDKTREEDAYTAYKTSRDNYAAGIDRLEATRPTETMGTKSTMEGYSPTNVQGLDPSTLAALKASNVEKANARELRDANAGDLRGWNGKLDSFEAGSATRGALAGAAGATSAGMVDTGALRSFDPTNAINTWAKGAWGLTQQGLTEQLRELRADAGGRHRLNTGWFDEDQGRVVRDVTGNFTNQLATKAVDAAGIYVDAQGRAVSAETQRLGDMDRFELGRQENVLRAAGDVDRLSLDAASRSDENTLARAKYLSDAELTRGKYLSDAELERGKYLDTYGKDVAFDAYDRSANRAEYLDSAEFKRRGALDDFNLNRAQSIDKATLAATQGATDARGNLYRGESGAYGEATDRYHDWLAGGSDRWQAQQNAQQQNKRSWLQTGLNAVGTFSDLYRTMRGGRKAA